MWCLYTGLLALCHMSQSVLHKRRKETQVVHLCLDMLYSLAALQKCTALFLQFCKSKLWNSSRSSWWPTAGDLSFQSKPPFSKGSNLKPTSIHRPQSKHTQQGDHHYEKKKKKNSLLHKVTCNIKYTFEKNNNSSTDPCLVNIKTIWVKQKYIWEPAIFWCRHFHKTYFL